jgi:hypothetical protein
MRQELPDCLSDWQIRLSANSRANERWCLLWCFYFQEGMLMLFANFTLLTEIEVLADTALEPNTNNREAVTTITSNFRMAWLGLLLLLRNRWLRFLLNPQFICHKPSDLRKHIPDTLLQELFSFSFLLLPELGVSPFTLPLCVLKGEDCARINEDDAFLS